MDVSLACVVVRSAGRSVAGWWPGGAVRCGCLAGSVLWGPENTQSRRQRGAPRGGREKKSEGGGTRRQCRRHPGPENTQSRTQRGRNEGEKGRRNKKRLKKKPGNNHKRGNPSPEGAEQVKSAPRTAKGKGEAHGNAPGRPARPSRPSRARTRTLARDPSVASSDPKGAVSASTRNSPGAPAESPVARRTVRETGRVSDRVDTRQTNTAHAAETKSGGTRQGQPHRGAPNGYDAERAQRPCLGRGQRQAQ